MKNTWACVIGILISSLSWAGAPADLLRDGDVIFHQSKSEQSQAIREATGSPWSHVGIVVSDHGQWKVAEAIGPVVKTPIEKFIARGRDGRFIIRRLKDGSATAVVPAIQKYLGIRYDVFFEWSADLIYCSELVWKAYHDAGIDLGAPQRFGDLQLDGPLVKRLIKARYEASHKKLNLEEPIVTPLGLLETDRLVTLYDSAAPKGQPGIVDEAN
jgi:cell wall-associated NlpC family hydrolase